MQRVVTGRAGSTTILAQRLRRRSSARTHFVSRRKGPRGLYEAYTSFSPVDLLTGTLQTREGHFCVKRQDFLLQIS